MAPQQIALDSDYVKRHVDSVVYLNPEYDTVFHVVAVDTVAYFLPDAVMRVGILNQPGPLGVPKPNFDNDYILTFSSEQERDSALAVLSGQEGVVSVIPAEPFVMDNTCPNDEYFDQQWALFSQECDSTAAEYSHIGATEAWDYSIGDSAMIVAVIDGGVQGSHEDFEIPGGGSKVFGDPSYVSRHGSQVAGVIGASTNNNSVGVAGVNWKTRLLAKDANAGPGYIDRAKAITKTIEAVDAGATAINHSYGAYGEPFAYRAMNYAYRNDVVSVASSGNNNTGETHWPSAHPGVISVGAHTWSGARAAFSNYGSGIDLLAPGVSIRVLDTASGSTYTYNNGTSFSAPHVTGAASLLKSYMPNLTNEDVKAILQLSAEDDASIPGYDSLYGHGLLRIDSAFRMIQSPNILRQLSVTSAPYVHAVSNTYACVFYDPVDFATGVYFAKRYEVRGDVTFPSAYYSLAGAWGRGNSTTGFSADAPNFSIGFAEFVQGSVTATRGTARTYVYELWGLAGNPVGFRPCAPGDVSIKYSVLGENLLVTPTLSGAVLAAGHNRLTWSDVLDVESNWHVDRKEGSGSWQTDYSVLPANSTSFTDPADGLTGGELYEYRVYPTTPNQTGSASNVVALRAKPKAPQCFSGYVVHYNEFSRDPVGYCSDYNNSECGGLPGGGGAPLGGPPLGGLTYGGGAAAQGPGGPPPLDLCLKTNMLVIEWDEPENQVISAIEGYRVVRIIDEVPPIITYEDQTTFHADSVCSELSSELFWLAVVTDDVYGNTSPEASFIWLTTGSIDYCGGIGDPQTKSSPSTIAETGLLPTSFALRQNHPNPFNAGTVIEYDLPIATDVRIEVFDVLGRRVANLAEGFMSAGQHAVNWDGRDSNGRVVASGMYFYRFVANGFLQTKKLVVLK